MADRGCGSGPCELHLGELHLGELYLGELYLGELDLGAPHPIEPKTRRDPLCPAFIAVGTRPPPLDSPAGFA
jgi:hypothetical protein